MIKVNDIEMYYEIHGEGTPLLMIMGWGGSSENWPKPIIDTISNHFKAIIFDNRGTGQTDKPDTKYSIKQMADDAAGLLDALEIQRAHIFGVSMGGMIAQEFGISHPDKTRGLVIGCSHCGPPHNIPRTDEAAEIMKKMIDPPEGISEMDLNRLYATLRATPEYLEEHGEAMAVAQKKVYPTPGWVRRRQWDAIEEWSSYDRLPSITAPTLVVHGSKDNWVLPGNAKIIADRIPGAKLIMYEESGHSFAEQIGEMIHDVLQFFKSLDDR
jgi:pimeloyl-ACP methyl ester carboxylesterase